MIPESPVCVRMSREVVEKFWMRTEDGRRVTVTWGEPDAEGFYDPMFTATDDGMRLVPAEGRAVADAFGVPDDGKTAVPSVNAERRFFSEKSVVSVDVRGGGYAEFDNVEAAIRALAALAPSEPQP